MRYLAALIVVLGSLVPCQAQNLLPNPGFDHDVSGWTAPPYYTNDLVWDSAHSAFGLGGSALFTTNFGINGLLETTACVPVTPGVTYSWGGQYRFPVGTGTHSIQFTLGFATDLGCRNGLGLVSSPASYPYLGPAGQWRTLAGPDLVAPANARAALFSVISSSVGDSEPHAVGFDDLYLGPRGTVGPFQGNEVPTLSPSGLLALALGLTVAAVCALRRRKAVLARGSRCPW